MIIIFKYNKHQCTNYTMKNGPKKPNKTNKVWVQSVRYKNVNINIFLFLINNETCEWGRVSFSLLFILLLLFFSSYSFFYGPRTCPAFLTITIFTYMTKKRLPNIQRGNRSLSDLVATSSLCESAAYNQSCPDFVWPTQYLTASH